MKHLTQIIIGILCLAVGITGIISWVIAPSASTPTAVVHPRDVHFRALDYRHHVIEVVEADSAFKPGDYITLDEDMTVQLLSRVN